MISNTPKMVQMAAAETVRQVFKGKRFNSPTGPKALNVFEQDIYVPEGSDEDVDTELAVMPYVIVRLAGGEVKDDNSTQTVEITFIVGAYDDSGKRIGWDDVLNILEDLMKHFCNVRNIGENSHILLPIEWAMQEDDSQPYYFGAMRATVTVPAYTTEELLEDMI